MGRPPSDNGALQERDAVPCPPFAVKLRGADGLFAKLTVTE